MLRPLGMITILYYMDIEVIVICSIRSILFYIYIYIYDSVGSTPGSSVGGVSSQTPDLRGLVKRLARSLERDRRVSHQGLLLLTTTQC